MSQPLKFEEVLSKARAVHGDRYTYIKLTKVANSTHVEYICSLHGLHSQSVHTHLRGRGCFKCSAEARVKASRTTLEQAKVKSVAVHGERYKYTKLDYVLDTGRGNGKYKAILHYICPDHGEQSQTLVHHIAGHGCASCGFAIGAKVRASSFSNPKGKDHPPVTYFESFKYRASEIHNNRYEYVDLTYVDGIAHIKYMCPTHGETMQLPGNHLAGKGCKLCAAEFNGSQKRYNFDDYKYRASSVHGGIYTYSTLDYSGNRAVIQYDCPIHGKTYQDATNHLSGHGCARCTTSRVSKGQAEIVDFLSSIGVSTEVEYRFPGDRRFADIVSHDHRLVIEFDGVYWHSSEYIDSSYHLSKSELAWNNGYRCIHIYSTEWENRRYCVEMLLRSVTKKIDRKVPGRNTTIRNISHIDADTFLGSHHIQGAVAGEPVGLMFENKLCAVMVFKSLALSREKKTNRNCAEIIRYATSDTVVGGFSKLLKYFLRANPEIQKVVSYSDLRMFTGNVYEVSGFIKQYTTRPDYMYLERGKLYHKSGYQKSKLAKRFGAELVTGKTEKQITEEQGIYRVYDCGKIKWLFTR